MVADVNQPMIFISFLTKHVVIDISSILDNAVIVAEIRYHMCQDLTRENQWIFQHFQW